MAFHNIHAMVAAFLAVLAVTAAFPLMSRPSSADSLLAVTSTKVLDTVSRSPSMSHPTKFRIVIENESPMKKTFFIFMKPLDCHLVSTYHGDCGPVYTNSLGVGKLYGKDEVQGDQLKFSVDVSLRAGAQRQTKPLVEGAIQTSKVASTFINTRSLVSSESVETGMSIDAYGMAELSAPSNSATVSPDGFRIATPDFKEGVGKFNIGTSILVDGVLTMASFVQAMPDRLVDVRPTRVFYVAEGAAKPGSIINFDTMAKNAVKIDTTTGQTTFFVKYNADGSFTLH